VEDIVEDGQFRCVMPWIWQAKSRKREAIEAGILIRGMRPTVITFPVKLFSPSYHESLHISGQLDTTESITQFISNGNYIIAAGFVLYHHDFLFSGTMIDMFPYEA
jgi:hypothetical protein